MTHQLSSQELDRLAGLARGGDGTALAQLYESLGPSVLGFLKHLLEDQDLAEDILQDVFLRLFEGRGTWQAKGNLKAWLFTVARRLALDKLRRTTRQRTLIGRPEARAAMGTHHPPDAGLALSDLDDVVARVLATLPTAYETAVHLRLGQGFTYAEMATICHEPQGTLRSRVHHTLGLLRRALAPEATKGIEHG